MCRPSLAVDVLHAADSGAVVHGHGLVARRALRSGEHKLWDPTTRYTDAPLGADEGVGADSERFIMLGRQPAKKGVTKVVLATNAAESSITLPDVDVVIDLGTHKQVQYDEELKVTRLLKAWVSKASATQRAGRTARVRPGSVYRLYSEALFDAMSPHDTSEIHRSPLEATVLQLRSSFDMDVLPILRCVPEVPQPDPPNPGGSPLRRL